METETTNGEIIGKLAAARVGFAEIEPDRYHKHLDYHYASLGAIIAAVTPALSEQGLAVVQGVEVELADQKVKVQTEIRSADEKIDFGAVTIPIAPIQSQSLTHATGAALTYARRYGYLAACGLDAPGAPDESESQAGNSQSQSRSQRQTDVTRWHTRKDREMRRGAGFVVSVHEVEGRFQVNLIDDGGGVAEQQLDFATRGEAKKEADALYTLESAKGG